VNDAHVTESAGAYALGALTPEEAHAVETHAATCPQCREEIAQLRGVVSLLPLAASAVEPSTDLKARVLRAGREEDQAGAVLRRAVENTQRHERRPGFWRRPIPVWAGIVGWAGLGAACILAGVLIGAVAEQSRMAATLSRLSQPPGSALEAPAAMAPKAERVYPVTTENFAQAVELIDQSQVWDFSVAKTGERMPCKVIQPPHVSHAMIVTDMPPAKAGMVYQVWLVRRGKIHRGGVVMPGHGVQTIIPMRVQSGDVIAFSVEPQGGSAVPTGPFVMEQTL
jgi:anti-sigma-K factor RskA